VPPKEIRQVRDLTRLRATLVHERSRHKQRAEKMLEDAQIKVSGSLSDLWGVSGRRMLAAMAGGQRDPQVLADLAHPLVRAPRARLVEALTGVLEAHHAYILGALMELVDGLDARIDQLTARIEWALGALPGAQALEVGDGGAGDPGAGVGLLGALERIREIPGIGLVGAQAVIGEIGLDMSRFPTAGHLVSWAKFSPMTIQSGAKSKAGKTGKGNAYLAAVLGEAAASAGRTKTFLGARYKRLVVHRGKKRALVAVARSILIIIWHLLNDPTSRYNDLGPDYHQRFTDPARKTRDLVRQLTALGHEVTLTAVPQPL
jgi:transposase